MMMPRSTHFECRNFKQWRKLSYKSDWFEETFLARVIQYEWITDFHSQFPTHFHRELMGFQFNGKVVGGFTQL